MPKGIRYICKKNDWQVSSMIVISRLKKEVSQLRYNNSGKIGRPKKELIINERTANSWYKGNYFTDWHIHLLLVSKPSYALRNNIKKYIDKNWFNIECSYKKEPFNINNLNKKQVYKKNCNIKIADYFISQSEEVLFCNYNFGGEESLKCNLKEYYREYLKCESAKIRLCRKLMVIEPKTDYDFFWDPTLFKIINVLPKQAAVEKKAYHLYLADI